MKAIRYLLLVLVPVLFIFTSFFAGGQSVPALLNYQGRLLNSAGQPVEGSVDLTFSFYAGPASDASLLYRVVQPNVTVSGGIYQILIGSGTLVPGDESSLEAVFRKHSSVYLGVKVNGDAEMVPRARISSVPYSLQAGAVDGRWLDSYLSQLDYDGDGYIKAMYGGTPPDCDDSNPLVYPHAAELCDGVDNQCPGDAGYGLVDENCTGTEQLLRDTVDDLIAGSGNFAGLKAQLEAVKAQDPANPNTAFFIAVTDFMEKLRASAVGAGGTVCNFKDLYTRSGLYNAEEASGEFWKTRLERNVVPFTCFAMGGCTVETGCRVEKRFHNYLFCDQNLSWQNARSFCQSWSGDLVTINDDEKDAWVAGKLTQSSWIGLYSLEGPPFYWWFEWEWANGEEVDYENWAEWFPYWLDGYTCVEMDSSYLYSWTNNACGDTLPFICEEQIDTSQGDVWDTTPGADEWNAYMDNCLIPYLEQLQANLDTVPTGFEYALMNVDQTGPYFDFDPADDTGYFWIDYGDAKMLQAGISLMLADLKTIDAYDGDSVVPNDFDEGLGNTVDAIGLIQTRYTDLGRLTRVERLSEARADLGDAYNYYQQGMNHILAEAPLPSENGLLTMGRQSEQWGSTEPLPLDGFFLDKLVSGFDNTADQQRFIADETYFRNWAQGILDSFSTDAGYAFDAVPGGTVDPNKQAVMNFYRFWQGIDFRDAYAKFVTDPLEGTTTFGVSDLDELNTTDILTFFGVLEQFNGVAPTVSDVAWNNYELVVDNPPYDTKLVDGMDVDWDYGFMDSVMLGARARAIFPYPRPETEEIYAAVDGTNLYLLITTDVTTFRRYLVECQSQNGYALILWLLYDGFFDEYLVDPLVFSQGLNVSEISVPLSNFFSDQWVEIHISAVTAQQQTYYRSQMYVKIQ